MFEVSNYRHGGSLKLFGFLRLIRHTQILYLRNKLFNNNNPSVFTVLRSKIILTRDAFIPMAIILNPIR